MDVDVNVNVTVWTSGDRQSGKSGVSAIWRRAASGEGSPLVGSIAPTVLTLDSQTVGLASETLIKKSLKLLIL